MNNCIFDSNDNTTIGFYEDLQKGFSEQVCEFVDNKDYEQAQLICDLLTDLESYREFNGLLVVSDNNGMGTTITKYGKD